MSKIYSQSKIKFPRDTERGIREITIKNCQNTQIVQILREKCDEDFIFKVNFLSRLPKLVELKHNWIKKNFNYQEPEFYSRFFDESENGLFEFTPALIKTYDKNKSVPDAPKLYILQGNKNSCVFY